MKQMLAAAIYSRIIILSLSYVFGAFGAAYDVSSNSPLVAWDAVYFKKLASTGSWDYEHEFAFFPGYPLLVRGLAHILSMMFKSSVSWDALILLSGVAISNASFVMAVFVLYKLSKQLKMSDKVCRLTALAFILNPSSVFMSSMYTESLFALLSFCGMYYYSRKLYFISCLFFIFSGAVRANGILYSGFFIFAILSSTRISIYSRIKLLIYAILIFIPFFSFQYLGKMYFCSKEPQQWCDSQFIYQYVQKKYWNNGWMAYYEVKQIPNFMIASPFLALSIYGIHNYISADYMRFLTLGYKSLDIRNQEFHSRLLPFYYLWTFMLFMVSTLMHVQVILRFFTCLPPLYWTIAGVLKVDSFKRMILLSYLLVWSLVGIVLFSNFYPPA